MGFRFLGWSGDLQGTGLSQNLIMNGNKTVRAIFEKLRYEVVTNQASGGAISGGGTFEYGSVANLQATPESGYSFIGWGDDASGESNPLSLLVDGNKTVTAFFELSTYNLTIPVSTGGTVSGGGSFQHGMVANLLAQPAEGYAFIRWLGDSNGSEKSACPYYAWQ